MLFQILDNLRSKPKHVRDQYAFGVAVFCTLAIGGVWSLSLPARFGSESQVAALASTTNAVPFTNFFTQLKNQFSGVKEAIEALPKATSTQPLSAASSTAAALDLQLSAENKEQIQASSSAEGTTNIQFGSGAKATTTSEFRGKPIMVGTSSAEGDSAR